MKFLIVDDDETIHMLLGNLLAPFAECRFAEDGKKAVALFEQALAPGAGPFDAVFMDIIMPGMDGHATVEKLRELERASGTGREFKLVMLTSLSDAANVSKAYFRGLATCYIVKPFERDKVLEDLTVNNVLAK
jgi:two-component system chemotaxis response regulator CheY